jgi:amino acid permease
MWLRVVAPAVANLFISAAGAGLLSYPFAVSCQGIALNVILTALFALANGYTDLVLGHFAEVHRGAMRMHSFEELTMLALGKRG